MIRIAPLALLLLTPGCFWFTTKHEGDTLRRDVKELKTTVDAQQAALGGKMKQLDESVEKATKLLSRNSADIGTEVEKALDAIATLTAQNESLRQELEGVRQEVLKQREQYEQRLGTYAERMEAVEKYVAARMEAQAAAGDKDKIWSDAQKKMADKSWADARTQLRSFIQKFPQDARADDAQFMVGKTFQEEKDHEKAIAEYQRVIDSYPNGDMVDDAFLQAGLAALDMKWCVDAGAYLGELARRYPSSPLVKQAKDKLAHIKKNAKNKTICQT
jgi:TolA-binding protein